MNARTNYMKRTLITFFTTTLLLISTMAFSQESFTVPLSDPAKRGKLKAHLNYGSITVKGTGRKDVLVKYVAGKSVKDCEDCVEKPDTGLKKISGGGLDLEVTENANQVQVKSNSWNTKVDLEIEVPSNFDLDVQTYNDGNLIISNIIGEVVTKNYNGSITALGISGTVVGTTYNGDIRITYDKVTESTPLSYSTYNGDIDLTFPSSVKATLKVKTERGDIYSGFDFELKSSGPIQKKDEKSGVYKVIIDEWKKGDINGGGPEFTLRNYNGDIYIRKK